MRTETVSMHWPGEKGRNSVRGPIGLKQKLDAVINHIQDITGVRFSRNEFIIKSIKHYLTVLAETSSKEGLMDELDKTD